MCETIDELEALAARIEQSGNEVSWEERDTFEGYIRFHTRDVFGNRVEMMTRAADLVDSASTCKPDPLLNPVE